MAHVHSPRFLALVETVLPRVREIDRAEVAAKLERREAFQLLDVREESDYAVDHLPGARHLGKGILERDIEVTVPDPAAEIVVYCGGGYRSALAADSLQRMGYTNVRSMAGGIRGWREDERPLEAGAPVAK
jgi:rhodanese-related sulfurtransferase